MLIRLGFRILRGGILTAAPHGVWSYHHEGDNDRYRGGPPGFWEVMEGTPVAGTILQRLTEALDGGHALYRSWGATNLFSVSRGRVEACWKGSEFLVRALRMLRDRGRFRVTSGKRVRRRTGTGCTARQEMGKWRLG